MKDQKVIQAFSSHTQEKTFTHSICPARVRYGVRSTLISLVIATCAKFGPNFLSLSRMR
jgi:Na+/H+-dicarboxylate symporter